MRFGNGKQKALPRYCLECDVRFACHGGCIKDRIVRTPDGEPGLNYLCPGYKDFFHHVDEPMRRMCDLLRQERAPADIVAEYRARGVAGRSSRASPAADQSGYRIWVTTGLAWRERSSGVAAEKGSAWRQSSLWMTIS